MIMGTPPNTLDAALRESCKHHGTRRAVSGPHGSISYGELEQQARAVADRLIKAGLAAYEIVHVKVSNQAMDIAALLGVWLANGVAAPIHRDAARTTHSRIHEKTRARFEVDIGPPATAESWIRAIGDLPPPPRPLLEGAALVIFTSGSTGEPKGVVISHRAFHGKIREIDRLLRFQADDTTLLVLNIAFSFGLWIALLTLLKGGRIVMLGKFDARSLLGILDEERITRVGMVPTMIRSFLTNPSLTDLVHTVGDSGALRQIVVGGEALGHDLARNIAARFPNTELVDVYGSTETSTSDFMAFPTDRALSPSCIGQPSGGVRFMIRDAAGKPVPAGQPGELLIQSPYLMSGYLADSTLTQAAFLNGWFRTGDLARQIDDTRVELVGRIKELINRGGNKIAPSEIETVLCRHDNIAQVIITGLPDAMLGERIHAGIVPKTDAPLGRDDLTRFLSDTLEKFKLPDYFYVIPEIPNNGNGKVDRKRFGEMIRCGEVAAMKKE